VEITASLMWAKKRDGDFAAGADLALQALPDFSQGEIRAEMGAQFG
jgi:hypothetical protein